MTTPLTSMVDGAGDQGGGDPDAAHLLRQHEAEAAADDGEPAEAA